MSPYVGTDKGDGGANGTTSAARAHETVTHGRAHLDYQRRIAAASVHRDDLRVVRDTRKGTT